MSETTYSPILVENDTAILVDEALKEQFSQNVKTHALKNCGNISKNKSRERFLLSSYETSTESVSQTIENNLVYSYSVTPEDDNNTEWSSVYTDSDQDIAYMPGSSKVSIAHKYTHLHINFDYPVSEGATTALAFGGIGLFAMILLLFGLGDDFMNTGLAQGVSIFSSVLLTLGFILKFRCKRKAKKFMHTGNKKESIKEIFGLFYDSAVELNLAETIHVDNKALSSSTKDEFASKHAERCFTNFHKDKGSSSLEYTIKE